MWEYKRIEVRYRTINELNDQLNDLGKEDWEIIFYEEISNEEREPTKKIKMLLKRSKNN